MVIFVYNIGMYDVVHCLAVNVGDTATQTLETMAEVLKKKQVTLRQREEVQD